MHQIDDLEVGRYVTIPEIGPIRSPSSASPPPLTEDAPITSMAVVV